MSSFTTPLDLQANDDGVTFTLLSEFIYELGSDPNRLIVVPKGFRTDFASVPQIFWNILPPWGKYGKAAVLHDFLYKKQEFNRKFCDDLLLEAMTALDVPAWKRNLIYWGVRLGGFVAWNEHTKENQKSSVV